jgi:hypothetical protein
VPLFGGSGIPFGGSGRPLPLSGCVAVPLMGPVQLPGPVAVPLFGPPSVAPARAAAVVPVGVMVEFVQA